MATLKAVVRNLKADGLYQVYIRIVHRSRMGYIKTNKYIHQKQVSESGELIDPVVSEYCARAILKYNDLLNRKDITALSVAEVIEYLTKDDSLENFSEYAKLHISRMEKRGQMRNAKNYKLAVAHLERFLGTNQVTFAQLSCAGVICEIER